MCKEHNYSTLSYVVRMYVLMTILHFSTSGKNSIILHRPSVFIYGETDAKPGQFPYMVSVEYNTSFGSGVLVSQLIVISRSGIFTDGNNADPEKCTVTTGIIVNPKVTSKSSQRRVANEINFHKDSNNRGIAVVIVKEPFELNEFVNFAYIAEEKLHEPTECTIVGYGQKDDTNETRFQAFADSITVSPASDECQYVKEGNYYCSIGNGSLVCDGNTGGPALVCNGMVYGILSHWKFFSPDSKSQLCDVLEVVYIDLSAMAAILRGYHTNLWSTKDFETREITTGYAQQSPKEVTDMENYSANRSPGLVGIPTSVILVVSPIFRVIY